MDYCLLMLLLCINSYEWMVVNARINNDTSDSLWSTDQGNSQNTYHIEPSMPTNYTQKSWIYEYNLTSQDLTQFGLGAGINGDIYFFLSLSRYHRADFLICLTSNGIVRWKLYLEPVPDMLPVGVSNIVSDSQGVLFYTVSWTGDESYTAKICRITEGQTPHPIQECVKNYQLYNDITTPLLLNEKYDLLVTAVTDDDFESVPAVLNRKTLGIEWINRHFFGAGMSGHYRCDINTGDILWIGGDRNLLKFNHNGKNLINNYTQLNDDGINFVLDKQKQIIIRPWQNMTDLPWKYVVSSYDVSTREIKLRWNWHPPSLIVANDDMTTPTIDDNGTVYMSSMPLVFSIDNMGKTLWTSELATSSEMKTYQLISSCIAMNLKRRTLYIVSGSPIYQKSKFLYFITAVNMDTGKVIKRIDVNVGSKTYVIPQCPILIGDEMFYFAWLTGQYPDSVPFKITGIKQV